MNLKEKLHIKLSFQELPLCIQTEIIKFIFVGVFGLIFGVIYLITSLDIQVFLFIIILLLIYTFICLSWIYRFVSDKIWILEGEVIAIDDSDIKGKLKSKLFQLVRVKYMIRTSEGYEFNIVKTTRKIMKVGLEVRVYTSKEHIYEHPDKTWLVNTVYYTEILKQPKHK